ncbi:hypothetical protein RB195_010585 [Necator americanus]|uniref:Uncharacterized protein n=1 Tax=Necator americanus TaxID=51031 RepID=A0ABR1CZX3_NECAM
MTCYILFLGLISFSEAVSLSQVRIACAADPKLPFCDSHVLGHPVPSTAKPLQPSTKPSSVMDLGKELPGYTRDEQQQFFTWLIEDQKDEVTDSDVDTEELESSHHAHGDVGKYCAKYKPNFDHYCKKDKLEKLDGILPQFCSVYRSHCGVEDFPKPGPLLETKQPREEAAESPREAFTGSHTKYCENFLKQYRELCNAGSTLGKAEEFCTSYRDSCDKQMSKSSSSSAFSKEIGDIEDVPEHEEAGGGAQPSEEKEEKDTRKDSRVARYCEKYWENFNFYCAGESTYENEKFCRSYRTNCPQKISSLKASPSFLGGKEKGGEFDGENVDNGGRPSLYLYKGTREEYCNKFAVNYEYYCKGESDDPQITAKFCPSYKKGCKDHIAGPPSPFNRPIPTRSTGRGLIDANFPDLERPEKGSRRRGRKRAGVKRRACTADCDEKIFPHCTQSCKCDYAYPFVQKFCNPPPLPFFLNTCRLWYGGCPKYERYHYASQFVYSKAEKGKKVELPANSKPFSVVSPNGERIPVVVRQPGINTVARDDPLRDTVDWASPVILIPEDFEPIAERMTHNATEGGRKDSLSGYQSKAGTTFSQKDRTLKDDAQRDSNSGDRAKDIPIVPSDSVFSNAIQQYGAFTDNSGILHRPRSRSPFTKPGLWEANPDNPHNRDHANKWYYHPESVNIDWLGGQLAWGAHWAVPAAGVGGTDGFSTVHFPTLVPHKVFWMT